VITVTITNHPAWVPLVMMSMPRRTRDNLRRVTVHLSVPLVAPDPDPGLDEVLRIGEWNLNSPDHPGQRGQYEVLQPRGPGENTPRTVRCRDCLPLQVDPVPDP
jgi:hypothetical protein